MGHACFVVILERYTRIVMGKSQEVFRLLFCRPTCFHPAREIPKYGNPTVTVVTLGAKTADLEQDPAHAILILKAPAIRVRVYTVYS